MGGGVDVQGLTERLGDSGRDRTCYLDWRTRSVGGSESGSFVGECSRVGLTGLDRIEGG